MLLAPKPDIWEPGVLRYDAIAAPGALLWAMCMLARPVRLFRASPRVWGGGCAAKPSPSKASFGLRTDVLRLRAVDIACGRGEGAGCGGFGDGRGDRAGWKESPNVLLKPALKSSPNPFSNDARASFGGSCMGFRAHASMASF